MDEFKRNQIPTFGNWDYSDGLPITQYFESARQAGLFRYNYGDKDLYGSDDLLYSNHHHHHDLIKPPSITVVSRRRTKGGVIKEKRNKNNNNNNINQVCNIKEQKKLGRVYDVTEPAKHHHSLSHHHHHNSSSGLNPNKEEKDEHQVGVVHQFHHYTPPPPPRRTPKAVDEDLYKIPPELLYKQPKRKKMLGLFSCLVPTCAA